MPRYFFDFTAEGRTFEDDVGSLLPHEEAAKLEAVQVAAQWMRDNVSVAGAQLEISIRNGSSTPSCIVIAWVKVIEAS